jgi:hypothetical protein
MRILNLIFPAALIVSACTPTEKSQTGETLRSDIPLRSVTYFVENDRDRAEMDAVCTAWKASQRPITSWPAVVTENCNNMDSAKYQIIQKREREKFKRQMGI